MSTLAIATWHAEPQLLVEQVAHYNAAFEGEVTHLININADFHDRFWKKAAGLGIDFKQFENLIFLDPPVKTYYAGIAHAFFAGVQEALRQNVGFEYIYWHTSSDLLVKRGLNSYIKQFDVGFGKSSGVKFKFRKDHRGFDLPSFEVENPTVWLNAISHDHRIAETLKAIGLDRLYKKRSEGCFFRRDIFFELMYPLTSNLSIKDMANPPKPYPLEEYLFAQCVEFFCARHEVKRASHVVSTSKADKGIATSEEIEAVLTLPNKFGIKRFPPELESPQRKLVRESLGPFF